MFITGYFKNIFHKKVRNSGIIMSFYLKGFWVFGNHYWFFGNLDFNEVFIPIWSPGLKAIIIETYISIIIFLSVISGGHIQKNKI